MFQLLASHPIDLHLLPLHFLSSHHHPSASASALAPFVLHLPFFWRFYPSPLFFPGLAAAAA
jgi:hypothetical protein